MTLADSLQPVGNVGGRSRTRTYDPLIKSQLLYHLSYAPGRRPKGPTPKVAPLTSPRSPCPAAAHHRSPNSSRLMRTSRLTWALSTKPKPTIMVSIEVPP